ncbi:hypothetical protein AB2Z22_000417 [Clostridium botulinum]
MKCDEKYETLLETKKLEKAFENIREIINKEEKNIQMKCKELLNTKNL